MASWLVSLFSYVTDFFGLVIYMSSNPNHSFMQVVGIMILYKWVDIIKNLSFHN